MRSPCTHAPLSRAAVVGAALVLAILGADVLLPLGVATGFLYVIPVLLGLWATTRSYVFATAAAGSVLVVASYCLSPPGNAVPWMVALNRSLSVSGVWVAAAVVLRYKRVANSLADSQEALRLANGELERRVAERTEELRRSQEQLLQAQKMEAIGRLAGGVAHDFNNLLTVILGYTALLLGELDPGDSRRKRLEIVHDAGERAQSLTRQLLAFGRKQILQPKVLDLNEAVGQMSEMIRRLIGENIDLAVHLVPGLGRVEADPGQIDQILLNLAVNARDAMPEGGKLTIETANVVLDEAYVRDHPEARPGPHVMLAVTDTGHGMDEATRARLFEPFFTTKERGKGTGLGLSTSYGIVKQSGGNIWVYSEPGRGTTFKVYLPRVEREPEAVPVPTGTPARRRGEGLVLVVEDDTDVGEFLRDVLEGEGYKALGASSTEEALRLFEEHTGKIDLLLTDVVVPSLGGAKLAAALQERDTGLRLLYMSGYTDNAIVHHGVLDPGTAFLEKPISPDALLAKVREMLGRDPEP